MPQSVEVLSDPTICSTVNSRHPVLQKTGQSVCNPKVTCHDNCDCAVIESGGWWAGISQNTSATQLYFNLGAPIALSTDCPHETSQWLTVRDMGMKDQKVTAQNSQFSWSVFSVAVGIETNFVNVSQLQQLVKYLTAPQGLTIHTGTQVARSRPLLELTPDAASQVAMLSVPKPSPLVNPAAKALMLPLRVGPFNPRWSVGLFQLAGYTIGYYGNGTQRYTSLGLDGDGFAYVPLYAARVPLTHVVVGCPVIAKGAGAGELFIQVTHVDEDPQLWHVEINNPATVPVTVTVSRSMDLPGLRNLLDDQPVVVTVAAGGILVL